MFAMFIIFFEQNFIAIYAAETGGDSDSDLSIREHPVQCMPVAGHAKIGTVSLPTSNRQIGRLFYYS